jgi:hypothetical protein
VPLVYSEFTGVRLLGGSDLDGDGVLDLVVGSHASPGKGGNGPGHVYAYSGATHALLWSQAGANFGDRIGLYVYDVGDLDGDGVSDVGTSVGHQTFAFMKTARFYSGASGAPIGGNAAIPSGTILLNVAAAGDVDGDGHGDWIGAVFSTGLGGSIPLSTAIGTVQVRTFAREALVGDLFTLRHAVGGVQTLTLDFGPTFAGREFRVLGSLTGTDPGIASAAGTIPLVPDTYFWSTRRPGGNGHLVRASGTLDAQGRATASFTLAPGSQRFPVGTILNHAAVALDASGTQPAAVSRAVPLVVNVDG